MSLGEKLIKCRKEKKMSQEELAAKLNVTRQTISNWELDQTSPDLEQAKKLAKLYNISLDELVDNNTKNILAERVTNTEKLAGLILKILKVIGILFVVYFILMIIAVICFSVYRKQSTTGVVEKAEINCYLEDNDYVIKFRKDNSDYCEGCGKELSKKLQETIKGETVAEKVSQTKLYFEDLGGSCD